MVGFLSIGARVFDSHGEGPGVRSPVSSQPILRHSEHKMSIIIIIIIVIIIIIIVTFI